jgi:plastocyanin
MLRMMTLLAILLALAAGFAPASAAGTATQPAKVQAHRVHVIVVDKMQYGPMPTGVRAGDIIEWVNRDILEHSATARDGHFDVDLKPGASGRITAAAGSLEFFCRFHPTMTGTVVVVK